MLNFCRATVECPCFNCLKISALANEFGLDRKYFETAVNRLGIFNCGKGFGAKTLIRLADAIESYKVKDIDFDQKNLII